ncbi:MAG: polysaccharide pyruvyl transferase CsaB [Clostridiales bacterium]|jgi:polysaccharide pyruvyl transferase CsaB|nr:polysaccharide pyruvyl transferase CsaB [Clostridiales bacterium]
MNSFEGIKVLMALMGMDIGGAETHVLELCKELKKHGLDVYVVSNGGVYEGELIAHGIKHFRAPLHNKKIKNLVASYLGLRRIIMENDIRLVHAHARIPAFLCGMLQKKLHFTFVTTAHALFSNAIAYRILTNFGDASIAIAEDIKENLVKNYRMRDKSVLLTVNGINIDTFGSKVDFSDILKEFNLEDGHTKIVNISRMDKDMSHAAHRLIEIAPAIFEKNPNCRIIIVGSGNDLEAVAAKADAVNSTLGIRFIIITGTRTDVPKLLASADIFVGVSRSALEAMAAAKPVILAGGQGFLGVFDRQMRDEAVKTNFTCRGHSEVNQENLKRAIFSLMDASPDKIRELGEYAREMVQNDYSVEKMAVDTLGLYTAVRKAKKPIDALISGYYGSNNHGDDALLSAITEDLRKINPDIKIAVISKRPGETKEIYGVDTLYRFNFPGIIRALKRTNLLIMGGGSLIQDLTSTRSLVYYVYVMNQAAKHRAKIMLYANGIGPLKLEKNKRRALAALEKAEKITLRDAQSRQTLDTLGLKNSNVIVTADAAFRFKTADYEGAAALLDDIRLTGKKYFCVSIRGWRSLKEDFVPEMAVFCDYMVEKYGLSPLFIPMQPSNDAEISTKILEKVKNQGYYLEQEFTIQEILAIVAGAEFMVGMRLHSIIYGANVATPVIGLVYDPKVSAMMQGLGQIYYMNPEDVSAMHLITLAEKVMENRDGIAATLAEVTKELEQKSAENAVIAHDIINRDLF